MKDVMWYFPETLEKASDLLQKEGVSLCGGGTLLLRSSMKNITGLVDLSRLSLNYFQADDHWIHIGSTQTFADVVENLMPVNPRSILISALSRAASTPLRNIITMGGSISAFPLWSDLMGPLMALEAEIILSGKQEIQVPISEYATNRDLRKGALIREIRFKNDAWDSFYFRATRTQFDFPSFTISILMKKTTGNLIDDVRIVIIGNKKKFIRLTDIENRLKNRRADDEDIAHVLENLDIEFSNKKMGKADTIQRLAGIELGRGFTQILRG